MGVSCGDVLYELPPAQMVAIIAVDPNPPATILLEVDAHPCQGLKPHGLQELRVAGELQCVPRGVPLDLPRAPRFNIRDHALEMSG
jgi:hypothetical protein